MLAPCNHVGLGLQFKLIKNISSECWPSLQYGSKSLLISQNGSWTSTYGISTFKPTLSMGPSVSDSKIKVLSQKVSSELQIANFCQPRLKNFSTSSYTLSNFDANSSNNDESINIGEGSWEEVYKGVLTAQFKLLKMFSIGSSVLGLCMQPILYEQIGNANLGLVVAFGSFIGFFTFASPCLIHYISKKYVTKLEYDSERDVYAATTLSFFLMEKKIHFKADDVVRPEVPGMFTSFIVNNNALFVDPHQFDDVDHYSRIMGYDKPIDFRPDSDKYKGNS